MPCEHRDLEQREPFLGDRKSATPDVSVCICTFRRPEMLATLLEALRSQDTRGELTYSVVVADNDAEETARAVVEEFRNGWPVETVYCVEARQNIALARNKAVEHASGEFIAFLDDDEFPQPDWLHRMWTACRTLETAGVLGPIRPHFAEVPPSWIIKGRLCERPEHRTGRPMDWEECRTGNVLLRRRVLEDLQPPFNPEFPNGGEDKDFFLRAMQQGHVFAWCNEGVVYEAVPPARWSRRVILRRALLRGKNILKHREGRARALLTSVVAVPAYMLILLPSLLVGQHSFMRTSVRLCDHLGRLLAFAGINPVTER
jgi:glycosyltransferase involved in cell wall biosynthesis